MRPTRASRRALQDAPALPRLQWTFGTTSTIRMSLRPRPADSVHRKRAFVVSAPPPGWLPSVVSLPGGARRRPPGWIRVFGPTSLPGPTAPATPAPAAASTSSGAPLRRFTRAWSHGPPARVSLAYEGGGLGPGLGELRPHHRVPAAIGQDAA